MNKKFYVLFILLGIALVSLSSSTSQQTPSGYIIKDQSVYWESSFGRLSAVPHISKSAFCRNGLDRHMQTLQLTWYKPDTELDFAFQLGEEENNKWVNKRAEILKEKEIREEFTCNYNFNYTLNPNYFWCFYQDINGTTNIVREHSFDGGNLAEKTAW